MDIIKDKPIKLFFKFLIPCISSMVGLSLYILFDTIFIGRGIGVKGLTALNISLPIFSMFISLGMLIGIGGATAFSINIGKKKIQEAQKIFTLSIILGLISGVAFTTVSLLNIDKLLMFLGASEDIFDMTKTYSIVLIAFSTAFIMLSILSNFIRNDNAPKLAMIAGLTGNFINIILDWIFIFIFHWGMFGAVLATVISPVISILIIIRHFKNKQSRIKLIIPISFKKTKSEFIKIFVDIFRILRNGLPGFLDGVAPGLVVLAFNKTLLNLIGNTGVAGYSIIANIAFVGIILFGGTAQAVQPLISQNFGAGNIKRIKTFFKYGLTTALFFGIVKLLIILFFPIQIIKIFNSEDLELISIAKDGLKIYFLSMPLMAINIISVAYFQAIESAKKAFIITLNRTVIFVLLLLYILPGFYSVRGVWLVVPVSELLCNLIFLCLFIHQRLRRVSYAGYR